MIHAKRRTIPLSKVRGTHGVSPGRVEELAQSTRPKPPILVIESRSGRTFQILDGHHRTHLARSQGHKTISAYVVPRSVYKTHAYYLDLVEALVGVGRLVIAPMSLDDRIGVTWRGRVRSYDKMRGDREYSVIRGIS